MEYVNNTKFDLYYIFYSGLVMFFLENKNTYKIDKLLLDKLQLVVDIPDFTDCNPIIRVNLS